MSAAAGGYAAGVRPFGRKDNTLMWMCLLTQAGVSLGLASEMSVLFPTFGPLFQSTLIAVILINQVQSSSGFSSPESPSPFYDKDVPPPPIFTSSHSSP